MSASASRPAAHAPTRVAIGILATLLVFFIGGCDRWDSPESRFDDYLSRLARTLDTDLPAPAPARRVPYPPRRDLLRAVAQPRTGWIGFFQLHRCGLMNLVSERNSILGRVAPPQSRLAYESRLLAGLIACRAEIEDGPADEDSQAFTERLDTLIALKRAARGPTLWNATWASDSMTHLFSVAGSDAGLEPAALGRDSRDALATLTASIETFYVGQALDRAQLTAAYEILDKSEYGGRLQIAAIQATDALQRAQAMLADRLAARPICFNEQPNRRARVLRTILIEIYGGGVQSYLASLVRAGRLWRARVDALIGAQRVAPGAVFTTYRQAALAADTGVWAALDHAIERHTQTWQEALGQCNLMPGG